MNELRKYDINIFGLENKRYAFNFESGDAFFDALEQNLIKKGQFTTQVVLNKSETMIRLDFHIKGEVEQLCDRSLDEYNEPIDVENQMLLKFSDHNEELTDEIELIERNTATVNVARFIFEFIGLSLPMKKLHPRFRAEEEDDDESEGKMIYQSEPEPDEDGNPPLDPRWEALRRLNDN